MIWKTTPLTGWGRMVQTEVDLARPEKLSALMALPPCPAVGNRRSYGDACLNADGQMIDMTRLDRILEFDRGTGQLHVEAGVTLGTLLRVLPPQGWMPPVLPGTGFATIGGAVANDVHGKNHHIAGSFGAHVTEITLLQGDALVRTGPDRKPGLFRATLGGLGQTGVILSVRLQLIAAEGQRIEVDERRIETLDDFIDAFDGSTAPYSVGWIDTTATGTALGRGVMEEGRVVRGIAPPPARAKTIPFNAPGALLNRHVVKAFNAAYLRRIPQAGRRRHVSMPAFFFPLDKIGNWNRLYGKAGFQQFQCVVPHGQTPALRDMLKAVAASGLASPLAVLKRLGSAGAGLMSFPTEGYTLALDLPNRAGTPALLAQLHERVLEAGGRIYLAKDAAATPRMIAAMYPKLPAFSKAADAADPQGDLATDLVRRLQLRKTT